MFVRPVVSEELRHTDRETDRIALYNRPIDILVNRCDAVVVRASASQSVDLRFISPSGILPKGFKK